MQQPVFRVKWRAICLGLAAAASAAAVACSDVGPTGPQVQSDLVASATVFNVLWRPTADGLELMGSARLTKTGGGWKRVEGATVSADNDSSAALGLQAAINRNARFSGIRPAIQGVIPGAAFSAQQSMNGLSLKARGHRIKAPSGKTIYISVVPDIGHDGRPAMATIAYVDGRVAMVTEYQHEKNAGKWRVRRSRSTFFDEKGHAAVVADVDQNGQATGQNFGVLEKVRQSVGGLLPRLTRLVQPDVLHAATPEDESGPCSYEAGVAAAADLAAIGAAGRAVAAYAALQAGKAAAVGAAGECAGGLIWMCAVSATLALEVVALQTVYDGAVGLAASAAATAVAANAAWIGCMVQVKKEETTDAPASTGGGGHELFTDDQTVWCNYTLYWDGWGNLVMVVENYCWAV